MSLEMPTRLVHDFEIELPSSVEREPTPIEAQSTRQKLEPVRDKRGEYYPESEKGKADTTALALVGILS